MSEPPGSFCDDRYAVTRLLGEGGQASSYEAVDKKHGKLVVVKRFRVRGANSWKEVELAEREARVLASLTHAAFPRYVEHFEEGGELFLVTELIEGESLAAHRQRGATFGEADVLRFLREAAAALDYLHGRAPPVVHRDIKPSNVLVRKDGSFAIIDFGAVRDKMKREGGSTIVGTFGYMAPEQFQGRAMPASDVYAVGATALVMLTGREPESLPHKGLAIDVPGALAGLPVAPLLVRALSSMLDPDPDVRASRIGPLLSEAAPEGRERPRPRGRDQRLEDKQRKREERRRRHPDWVPGYGAPIDLPPPIRIIVRIALLVASIAVRIALRVIVRTLLVAMSVVFGRAMRDAAATVLTAEKQAQREIARAGAWTRTRRAPEGEGARVATPTSEVGQRVAVRPNEDVDLEAEAEAEAESAERVAKARR